MTGNRGRGPGDTCIGCAMRYRYAAMRKQNGRVNEGVGALLNGGRHRQNTKVQVAGRNDDSEMAHTSLCNRMIRPDVVFR